MAPPLKKTLEYFQFNDEINNIQETLACHYDSIVSKKGPLMYPYILRYIYLKSHGYFAYADEMKIQGMENRIFKFKENDILKVINALIELKIFSKELFENYKIITSVSIQEFFFWAANERAEHDIIKNFILIDLDKKEYKGKKGPRITYIEDKRPYFKQDIPSE